MAAALATREHWLARPLPRLPGGKTLAAPVVGMAADLATGDYWLVAAAGGVFSFDAPFEGSAAFPIGPYPNPFAAVTASDHGDGYLLLPTNPAVEPWIPGRSGFALAEREWQDDGNLSCYLESVPLIQGPQYLLIGERVDGGDTSGYPAAVDDFEQLSSMPVVGRTTTQNAQALADTTSLNALFDTSAQVPCS
jgi:hypothetical protein